MYPSELSIIPDWKWGTVEGSRDLDRLLDRQLSFGEKLEWLEEAETLSLHFQAIREERVIATREIPPSQPLCCFSQSHRDSLQPLLRAL